MTLAHAGRARSSSTATGGLPDPVRALAAACLAAFGTAAAAEDCDRSLSATVAHDAPDWVEIAHAAPCAPYARLSVALGPVRFAEEAGPDGRLSLRLPRLPQLRSVAVDSAAGRLEAPLPDAAAPPPYWAVMVPGPGQVRIGSDETTTAIALGFPAQPAGPTALLLQAPEGPLALVVEVAAAACGAEIVLQVLAPGAADPTDLRLWAPPCPAAPGQKLQITLPPV